LNSSTQLSLHPVIRNATNKTQSNFGHAHRISASRPIRLPDRGPKQ